METTALGAALSQLGAVHTFAAQRPEPIGMGIGGIGGILGLHLTGLVQRAENVRYQWLCDVDESHLTSPARKVECFQPSSPRQTTRFEQVLEAPEVEAAVIATPRHWHAAMTLQANVSCTLAHFGEIAHRTCGRLNFNFQVGRFVNCEAANDLLTKTYREPYALAGSTVS